MSRTFNILFVAVVVFKVFWFVWMARTLSKKYNVKVKWNGIRLYLDSTNNSELALRDVDQANRTSIFHNIVIAWAATAILAVVSLGVRHL